MEPTPLLLVSRSIALTPVIPVGAVLMAPGWKRVTDEKLRPSNGIVAISFVDRVIPSVPSVVLRTGALPLLTSITLVAPTDSASFSFTVWLISSMNGGTVSEENPSAATTTLYRPIGRKRMLYTPAALVVAKALTPVSTFSAVILAFGITAPVGSVTSPVIEPVTVCAEARGTLTATASAHPAR